MGVILSLGIKLISRETRKELTFNLHYGRRINDNNIIGVLLGQNPIGYTSIPLNLEKILDKTELEMLSTDYDEETELQFTNVLSTHTVLTIFNKIEDNIRDISAECLLNDLKTRNLRFINFTEIQEQKWNVHEYFELKAALNFIRGILSLACKIDYDVQFEIFENGM